MSKEREDKRLLHQNGLLTFNGKHDNIKLNVIVFGHSSIDVEGRTPVEDLIQAVHVIWK